MGKYKEGKKTEAINQADFQKILDTGLYVKPQLHRALIVILYYSGARISEILALKREHFAISTEQKKTLAVVIAPIKRGVLRGAFLLDLEKPGVQILANVVSKIKGSRRIFPFTRVTAWYIVKRATFSSGFNFYPHYFRLNRCVRFLDQRDISLNEIRQWFGWNRIDTVNNYLGYSKRTTEKLSGVLD